MKVTENQYVPVLKWRQAEYQSLFKLNTKQKAEVVPLIVIPPIEYDFEKREPTRTVQEHIDKFINRYFVKWETRGAFIDIFPDLHDAKMDNGESVLQYIFDYLNEKECNAVPVLSRLPDTIYHCCSIALKNENGIAVRIHPDNILDDSMASCLEHLTQVAGFSNEDIDIIVDIKKPESFEPVGEFASALVGLFNSIHHIDEYRSFILLGTSIRLPEIQKPGGHLFRYEWALYKEILKLRKSLSRVPTFGDYTIETPDFASNLDFTKISPSAKIVYTTDNDWYVVKGIAYKKDTKQMISLSKEIMKSKYYKGPDFSYGDKRIKEIVDQQAKPGNLTTMKNVGISHHLSFILEQLSKNLSI